MRLLLCSHGLQSAVSPFVDVHLAGCSLRPEVRPLLHQQHLLQRDLQELVNSLQLKEQLQHNIQEQTESFPASLATQPASYQLDKEGRLCGLTLDASGFSPEELSVRQVGRKLRVSGKTEKKQEDGKGWSSYRLLEIRQEFDLPEGTNPEDVTCCMSPDGKLHIQAAKTPEVERELTIRMSSEEETQQSVCSQAGDSSAHTHDNTQDKPEHKD